MREQISFQELVDKVVNSENLGKGELSVWSGYCAPEDILGFLKGWDLETMPYRIWEYASAICFDRDSPPKDVNLLQKGRLFGDGGDLELLWVGGSFRWRFIGPAGISPPHGDFQAQDYWETNLHVRFHCYNETALLWGEHDGHRWYDSRVGGAVLAYPVEGKRVQLRYRVLSRAGQVEFVWYTGLEEWKEDGNV